MKYRTELCVITITRNVVLFLTLVLPATHSVNNIKIIRNNKLPRIKMLTKHFFSAPSEKFLRCRWPAQHFKLVIPFDDRQWSILDVKRQSPVFVERRRLGDFALGDVANDRDSADHLAFFIVSRWVVAVEKTCAPRLRNRVGTVLSNHTFACKSVDVEFVFPHFLQARKEVESAFAQHILAFYTRDALHRAVPGGVAEFTIEGDYPVDVRLQQALQEEIRFLWFVGHEGVTKN